MPAYGIWIWGKRVRGASHQSNHVKKKNEAKCYKTKKREKNNATTTTITSPSMQLEGAT